MTTRGSGLVSQSTFASSNIFKSRIAKEHLQIRRYTADHAVKTDGRDHSSDAAESFQLTRPSTHAAAFTPIGDPGGQIDPGTHKQHEPSRPQ